MNFETSWGTTGTNGWRGRGAVVVAAIGLFGSLAAAGCGVEGDMDDPANPAASTAGAEADVTATSGALSRAGTDLTAATTLPPISKPPIIAVMFVSDLKPDGVMRSIKRDASSIDVQINVTNIGNMAATAPGGTVAINGAAFDGTLHQYWNGAAAPANTINPGAKGYILVRLPVGTVVPCSQYTVSIDTGRNMQAGLPDPYANDQATVSSQCLSWTATINANNFTIAGAPLEGASLGRVVSSSAIGRTDGLRCSACHFENAARSYRPPVAQNSSAAISPTQVISGLTWTQPGGWADRFLQQPTDTSLGSKPYHLKILVQTWIDDGRNPGLARFWDLLSNPITATLTATP